MLELSVSVAKGCLKARRQRRINNPLANSAARLGERFNIVHIQALKRGINALVKAFVGEKLAVGMSSRGKPARYRYASTGQIGNHFT